MNQKNESLLQKATQLESDMNQQYEYVDHLIKQIDEMVAAEKTIDIEKYPDQVFRVNELLQKADIILDKYQENQAEVDETLSQLNRQRNWIHIKFVAMVIFLVASTILSVCAAHFFFSHIHLLGQGADVFATINWMRMLTDIILSLLGAWIIGVVIVGILATMIPFVKDVEHWRKLSKEILKFVVGLFTICSIVIGTLLSLTTDQISVMTSVISTVVIFIVLLRRQFNAVVHLLIESPATNLILNILKKKKH